MDDPDGYFHDVPEGWEVAPAPYDVDVLREQARWFFKRDGRDVIEERFKGEDPQHRWDDPGQLLVAVGEKFVLQQGCYSCHEIPGLESTMPIGVELTNWGSKTVDKLAWELIPNIFAEAHGWDLEEREEYKQFREHWIEQKLAEPRSFDRQKVKNPLDRLKMPWFDFDREQIKAIATFVVGLVDDEVTDAKMEPSAAQFAMNHGLQVVRQKNCQACHMTAPGTVTFAREGEQLTVEAELLPIGEDTMPPRQEGLETLMASIESYEDYYEEEIEEVGFRLLGVEPTVGLPGENVFVAKEDLVAVTPPAGGDMVRVVSDYYLRGIEMYDDEAEDPDDAYYAWNLGEEGEVEDVDGELRPYYDQPYDKIRWTFAPPVLFNEGHKLQRDWFLAFLMDPVALRRQMRVRMPTFSYGEGEAEAVADYFAYQAEKDWPARYAKRLRYAMGMDVKDDFSGPGLPWPRAVNQTEGGSGLSLDEMVDLAESHPETSGLRASTIALIEAGSKPDIQANLSKLLELGQLEGFRMNGPVDPHSQWVRRRSPSYLAQRAPFIEVGQRLATDPNAVNCYQCHWHAGLPPEQESTPIAWAPDLSIARERLREDWSQEWLWNPGLIYPGTSMPANFTGDPPQFQDHYPDSTNPEQVQAVLDWLYNFDRALTRDSN
jgi:mono/diheme cytochrome c family protein